jgi:hypothetical protein
MSAAARMAGAAQRQGDPSKDNAGRSDEDGSLFEPSVDSAEGQFGRQHRQRIEQQAQHNDRGREAVDPLGQEVVARHRRDEAAAPSEVCPRERHDVRRQKDGHRKGHTHERLAAKRHSCERETERRADRGGEQRGAYPECGGIPEERLLAVVKRQDVSSHGSAKEREGQQIDERQQRAHCKQHEGSGDEDCPTRGPSPHVRAFCLCAQFRDPESRRAGP